ncbi:thioredoxin [Ectothiorhodospira shaposhnikovii]|nr:thioredoxin [Ectothiorhodospira shaposhnikovii]
MPRLSSRLVRVILGWLVLALSGSVCADDQPPIDDRPRLIGLQAPDWFHLSFLDLGEDLQTARDEGKRGLVVYLGMDDCPYCEALFQVNFQQPDIVEYTRRHFLVVALDVLGSRTMTTLEGRSLTEREFAIRQRLNFTPSFLFHDLEGEPVFILRGYHSPYRFRAALEYVADAHYQRESFRDYLARADPPPRFDPDDLNHRDFFRPPPHGLDRSQVAAERPLVVFFEQGECHACDVLHTEPLGDPEVLDLLSLFDVVQLDMWSDTPVVTPDGRRLTARQWAEEMDLFYAPTLVFFDELGEEILRVDSVIRLHRLQAVLEYVLTRGYEEYPSFQRWRTR